MQIGNITFGPKPVFLAPMEDVTDIGFRMLCKRFGASMVYTEFVSAEALVRSVKSTMAKLTILDEERPVGIQIYGRDAEAMVEAAKMVEAVNPDLIDLNFGCPVKKVAGKGAGAGMLRNVPLLLDITREVVKAVKVPVTVKTRLGWDHDNIIIGELAEQLQDCGISALTIHGRTRSQMYTGEADWEPIGEVKKNPRIHIPIIGNGDITSPEKAKEAFDRYGVDAVMVGRATLDVRGFLGRYGVISMVRRLTRAWTSPGNWMCSSNSCASMWSESTRHAGYCIRDGTSQRVRYSREYLTSDLRASASFVRNTWTSCSASWKRLEWR